jgi:hypothetical protein
MSTLIPLVIKIGVVVLYILSSGLFFPRIGERHRVFFIVCGLLATAGTIYFVIGLSSDYLGEQDTMTANQTRAVTAAAGPVELGTLVRDIISLNKYDNAGVGWDQTRLATPAVSWRDDYFDVKFGGMTYLSLIGEVTMRLDGTPDMNQVKVTPETWVLSALARAPHRGPVMVQFDRRTYISSDQYTAMEAAVTKSLTDAGVELTPANLCGNRYVGYSAKFLDKSAVIVFPRNGGSRGMTMGFSVLFRTAEQLSDTSTPGFEHVMREHALMVYC